jgi:actin-related protein
VIVIHPGSRFTRIGRACDVNPVTVPSVVARKLTRWRDRSETGDTSRGLKDLNLGWKEPNRSKVPVVEMSILSRHSPMIP